MKRQSKKQKTNYNTQERFSKLPIDLFWFNGKDWVNVWNMFPEELYQIISVLQYDFNIKATVGVYNLVSETSAIDVISAIWLNKKYGTTVQTVYEYQNAVLNYKNSFQLLKSINLN
jgi:hypothetical protein